MHDKMRKYAKFLLTRCVRLQKNTPLAIPYIPDQKEFVDILKEEAIKLGAKDVYLIESDEDKIRKILSEQSLEEIKTHPYFDRSLIKQTYDQNGCILWPDSFSKRNLKGLDEEKIRAMNAFKISSQKDSIDARRKYKFPSCIAAVATKEWADELFPNEEDNYEKLWDLIFKITMMDKEAPEKAWEDQIEKNTKRKNLLNELRLVKLRYKSGIGTNFEVQLPKDVIWQGTSKLSFDKSMDIIVNMPTYEVFTSPHMDGTNGVVISSVPLLLRGCEIKNIRLTFKDGKLVKAQADTNEDVLLNVIEEHEEMKYLGECAIVDYDSPINNTGITYKTILIDENRSSHIALGNAFVRTIPNGENMSDEELKQAGLNKCVNHVDVMIGTKDLSIIGTDIYGNEVPIVVDGNFVDEEIECFLKNRKVK